MAKNDNSLLGDPIPHTEAADFLRDKPVATRAIFDELVPELQARAFVITGVDQADMLQAARDRIAEIPEGADWRKVKKEVATDLEPWLGEGALRRVELLMRHHAYQAYAVSNFENLEANKDIFPFREYVTAQDERVRESHAALNKRVLPANSPFWDRHTPPWEYGCRCDVRGITAEEAGEIEAADKKREPKNQRVLQGAMKTKLEKEGKLVLGENHILDVRSAHEKGKAGPDWSTKDLRIPLAAIRDRYDDQTWATFLSWAESTDLPLLDVTVADWMEGRKKRAVPKKAAKKKAATSSKALADHVKKYPAVGNALVANRSTKKKLADVVAV